MVSTSGIFRSQALAKHPQSVRQVQQDLSANSSVLGSESLLLPYQQRWLNDKSPLRLYVKSRRIGISYTQALFSVLEAAKVNAKSTLYTSYNFQGTHQFIRDAEHWSKALNIACSDVSERMLDDRDILEYKIKYASGQSIIALSGSPRNIRGRGGHVIIDEAAHVDNLEELLAAAQALLIWSGTLSVISTHFGTENPFNQLLEGIESGDRPNWSVHRTDINQALSEGLYRRICLVQGKEWSQKKEDIWLTKLIAEYGVAANEELLCFPYTAKAGLVFSPDRIQTIDVSEVPVGGQELRAWDLATTEKDLKDKNDPCYTAGVKLKIVNGVVYILDVIAVQQSAGAIDDLLLKTAIADGKQCQVRHEVEPGSSGVRDSVHIAKHLMGFDVKGIRPTGSKVVRAKPLASQVNAGNVKMVRSHWNGQFKRWLHSFPEGKADTTDAASLAFTCLTTIAPRTQPSGSWSSW